MQDNIKYSGKLSEEEVEVLKSVHGEIYTLEVPANDEGTAYAVAYLKRPERQIVGLALHKERTNPIAAKEVLLRNCFITGDKRIMENDELFLSACTVLDSLLSLRQAELKKN